MAKSLAGLLGAFLGLSLVAVLTHLRIKAINRSSFQARPHGRIFKSSNCAERWLKVARLANLAAFMAALGLIVAALYG